MSLPIKKINKLLFGNCIQEWNYEHGNFKQLIGGLLLLQNVFKMYAKLNDTNNIQIKQRDNQNIINLLQKLIKLSKQINGINNEICTQLNACIEIMNKSVALYIKINYIDYALFELNKFKIDYLVYRYQKYKHAIQNTLNKKVIFLIGHSKCGKSTIMHYLASTKLCLNDNNTIAYNNYNHVNKELQHIFILNNTQNCGNTSNSIIPINFKLINNNKEYVVIDTPSIADHVDKELSISNRLNMIDIINNAEAVHFCMIVSEVDIKYNRIDIINSLFNIYYGTNYPVHKFSFLFNRWKDTTNIIKYLQSINKSGGKLHQRLSQLKQEDINVINPTIYQNGEKFIKLINNINNKQLWITNNKANLASTLMNSISNSYINANLTKIQNQAKYHLNIIEKNMNKDNYEWIKQMIYETETINQLLCLGSEITKQIQETKKQMNEI